MQGPVARASQSRFPTPGTGQLAQVPTARVEGEHHRVVAGIVDGEQHPGHGPASGHAGAFAYGGILEGARPHGIDGTRGDRLASEEIREEDGGREQSHAEC